MIPQSKPLTKLLAVGKNQLLGSIDFRAETKKGMYLTAVRILYQTGANLFFRYRVRTRHSGQNADVLFERWANRSYGDWEGRAFLRRDEAEIAIYIDVETESVFTARVEYEVI